jgi:uncharacterized protein YecE (DUF72 family)
MSVYVGTSGWHYKSWVGPFYPPTLPSEAMLAFYARIFGTVEINNSFYRLPADDVLCRWSDATPPEFVFAFKASQYLTHKKKLLDPAEPLGRVLHSAGLLRPKLGPILFQLPPHWRLNLDRLRAFLDLLPAEQRFAFEFRDRSWFADPVYQALADHKAAFCIYEFGDFRAPTEITADFVYVRLHGPSAPYAGLYDPVSLSSWAETIDIWDAEGRDVFCYFDNDARGFAARNAGELARVLARRHTPPAAGVYGRR